MEGVERELALLRAFAEQKLTRGSFVYDKVQDLLVQAEREHSRQRQQQPVMKGSPTEQAAFVLQITSDHPAFRGPYTLNVQIPCTLDRLKGLIEQGVTSGNPVDRILIRRTGRAFGTWDLRSLEQCEIRNNDVLVVSVRTGGNSPGNASGVGRLTSSGIQPRSDFERLSLALHAFMLDLEFIGVVELPSNVPGFAPSLKELPKNAFVHSSWNSQAEHASFMYKHKAIPGKQFQLSCVDLRESVLVSVAQRGGDAQSMELEVAQHVQDGNITAEESMREGLQRMVYTIAPSLRPLPAPAPAAPVAPAAQSSPSPAPSSGPYPSTPTGGYPAHNPAPGSVGGNDMDPFYGGVHIGGGGPGREVGPAGGSGNLVGPDHPMFFPDYEGGGGYGGAGGGFPGGLGGGLGGLPQPRFDPFGPVLGPNQDIGGAGVGNVGMPGRGGRGLGPFPGRGGPGRGRGAGQGGNFPGEPNPDHLRPPGW